MNELCMSYGEVLLAILSSESSKYYSINEMQYFLADRGINITENVIFNILRELEQRGKVERTARNHFRLSQVEQLEQITNKTGLHIAPPVFERAKPSWRTQKIRNCSHNRKKKLVVSLGIR